VNLLVNMDVLSRTAQKVVWQVNDITFWYFLLEIAKSTKQLRKVFGHLPDDCLVQSDDDACPPDCCCGTALNVVRRKELVHKWVISISAS
jgi:hypothetical protein